MIETERLILRPFNEKDKEAFFSLNSDNEVMKYFPRTLSTLESNNYFKKINSK